MNMPVLDSKLFIEKEKMTPLTKKMKFKVKPKEMPEDLHPFEKLQANFFYQFLEKETRQKLKLNRRPVHLEPSNEAYQTYMD